MDEAVANRTPENPYHIHLDVFEGPLDLLLHLIKEQQVDIYNIPVAKITEQYIQTIDLMKVLNLDIAGEFLLMAATLAHIKSQMLLPRDEAAQEGDEEGVDPREELVRRLLEYQKFKDVAERLLSRPLLFRDVFKREKPDRPPVGEMQTPSELVEVSVFKLVEAFHRLLDRLRLEKPHEVQTDNISIGEKVLLIVDAVRNSAEGALRFDDLFARDKTTPQVVVTFLALLEMLKRGLLRVFQAEAFAEIQLMGTPSLYGDWSYEHFFGTTEIHS
ncbi:MAG TPA: segregation/condensation protein A [Bdellovibrionota bacterium]|nr:segregation/condensation protein A [Bdellovibrionota bacterium]